MVPTLFRAMTAELEDSNCFEGLHYILLAGELLRGNDIKRFMQIFGSRIQLVNMYGPTETTLAKLFYRVQETDINRVSISVGKSIPGAQIMILNSDLEACLKGNIGEVYIRTPFISSGYYGDSELTKEVFIKNPFSQNPQDIIYKTGDLGKLLPDGDLELMGRTDHQVKLRGFRVELGEIENRLLSNEKVKEAVVVAREDETGGKYLCAYVVGDEGLSVPELRENLSKELPNYMIPAYFVQLEKLPLTPTGKVDRKVLPQPQASLDMGEEYVEPANEIEAKLVSIWEEVLGISGIGIKHNFFEIGGNSINSLKVIGLIKKEFDIDVSLGELMVNPTISAIAENIYTESILGKLECVVKLNQTSPEKKNIFIIHSIDGMVFHYKGLAKLLEPICNFYGIQARGILKEAILPKSVDELVKEYMYEMKAIQPEGPYIIGGHCFGMMFAYEMARMLEEQGDEVEKLIIIDEQVYLNNSQLAYMKFNTYLYKPYRVVKKLYYKHFAKSLDAEGYLAKKPKPTVGEAQSGEAVSKNFQYLGRNKYKYKGIINSPTFAIKAQDSVWARFTKEHWSKMTNGSVEIVEIPGDHWNLFNEPYVEELAKVMKRAISE